MSIAVLKQADGAVGFDLARDETTGLIKLAETDQDRQTSLTIMSVFSNRLASGTDELPAGTTSRRGYWGDYLLPVIQGVIDRLGSKLWTLSREKILSEVVARAKGYVVESLDWKLQTGEVLTVDVEAEVDGEWLKLLIRETTPSGTFESSYNYAWRR